VRGLGSHRPLFTPAPRRRSSSIRTPIVYAFTTTRPCDRSDARRSSTHSGHGLLGQSPLPSTNIIRGRGGQESGLPAVHGPRPRGKGTRRTSAHIEALARRHSAPPTPIRHGAPSTTATPWGARQALSDDLDAATLSPSGMNLRPWQLLAGGTASPRRAPWRLSPSWIGAEADPSHIGAFTTTFTRWEASRIRSGALAYAPRLGCWRRPPDTRHMPSHIYQRTGGLCSAPGATRRRRGREA